MKLFVIGSDSPNPSDWDEWDEIALVIAEDEKQARELARDGSFEDICEVPLTEAKLIYQAPSPELWWGEDA